MSNRVASLSMLALIVAILILSACSLPQIQMSLQPTGTPSPAISPTPSPTPTLLPCGTNIQCLIEAARECKPQTGTVTISVDLGVKVKITYLFTIKGKVENDCVFGVHAQNISVEYSKQSKQMSSNSLNSTGMAQPKTEQQRKQILSQVKNRLPNGTCRGSGELLAEILTRWQEGHFSLDDLNVFGCTK